jgi:hypothetical protein
MSRNVRERDSRNGPLVRGRMPRPEVTSQLVELYWQLNVYGEERFRPRFPISGFQYIGGMSISAARGRAGPEMTSPFDSLTPICYRLAVGIFRLSLTVQKLFDFFD